jgi:hypothetical protein
MPSLEAAGGGATSAMAVKCAFWWWGEAVNRPEGGIEFTQVLILPLNMTDW